MSRYAPQQNYSDNDYDDNQYGNSYGNGGQGYGNNGGYSDEPQAGKYGAGNNSYPMSSSNPYASAGSPRGYDAPKKKRNKWLWIGLPILLLIIIGAVLGGVLGTQLNKDDKSSNSGSSNSNNGQPANTGVPSGVSDVSTNTQTGANGGRILAIQTDSYLLPVYATGTATAGYSSPTVLADATDNGKWPSDPSPPNNNSIRAHPRIGAPGYKWAALPTLIANDPYMKQWNDKILGNASDTVASDPIGYIEDGGLEGSGVLDVAREMKLRVKNWAYAYHLTNETKYADRVFLELQTAAGNNTNIPFGADDGTRWNPAHFLDLAEFSAMFAIGYDWLYDFWSDEQRDQIMWSMINLGLNFGEACYTGASSASSYSWWTGSGGTPITGNWNCVINGGLTMAALAIVDRDPTGVAQRVIEAAVPNAQQNCFQAPYADGTWSEASADYWYFGTTGGAEMVAALVASYGDDRGLTTANPGWKQTPLFHMYGTGMTSKFNYGDTGPNKFSSTANSLFLWATMFDEPRYALYQRDQFDTSEPWSMFWYDPATSGTWWDGLALDNHFNNDGVNWATGRSTWADNNGMYWAMKSGRLTGHQTHGDLDLGDFVLDAAGQRWFGELGSGQYLSPKYFSSEAQDSQRWLYYRKRTEGQNTILINNANQFVSAQPSSNFGTTGTDQGLAPSLNVSTDDTAFYTADISSGYNNTVKRGIRFLNGRRQVLIQDDISGLPSGTNFQWRAHTNASITLNDATATLALGGQTMLASIIGGPSGATFTTAQPTPTASDPAAPSPTGDQKAGDEPNPGVTVLVVETTGSGEDFSLQVLLNPQWEGFSSFVTPSSVPIDNWSTTSHN